MWLCWIIGHSFTQPEKILGIFNATPYCTRCGRYVGSNKKRIENVDENDVDETEHV